LPEHVVICRHVGKSYLSRTGPIEALHRVDASVAAGTLAALVGPSGCGKSTLLQLLAGLDTADHGTLTIGGVDPTTIHGRALRAFRRERVTYVTQRPADNFVPHLTLRQHLSDNADLRVLAQLGLSGKLDRRASLLSGGEQARAGLGIALSRPTPIVLVDEPTAELDHDAVALVLAAIRAATDNGKTVIAATHDQAVVAAADTTIDLDHGSATPRVGTQPHPAQPTGQPGLAIERLTKTYGSTTVVEAVSLSLESGETGIILGRSGSGKSTLLMTIGGWLRPDSGTIVVAGAKLESVPGWQTVAYLPQRFGLLPELTLRENVELPFRLARMPVPSHAPRLLVEFGLDEHAERLPRETSIGQQQRAALARAVAIRPTLLLADEPTSHQDAASADRIWGVLREAQHEGVTSLIATNDPAAATHGNQTWRIDDGRLATRIAGLEWHGPGGPTGLQNR
jgi:ABC-type lipoprotein export system ATPase subunit